MSKTPQNMPPSPSPSSIFMPLGRQSRRGSLTSLSSNSQGDREALSQALDHIHTSASRSDTLTTFNEFTSPPSSSSTIDGKGLAGDFVHGGLSGLYSRFRGAVGGKRDKPSSPTSPVESADADASSRRSSRMADSIPQSEPSRSAKPGVPSSAASSRSSTAQTDTPKPVDAADGRSSRKPRSAASTAPLRGQSTNPTSQNAPKALSAPFVRATPSSVADPTLAPVNVVAYKDNGRASADHSRKNSATANPKPSPEQMHSAQRPDKTRGTSDHSTKSAITSNTLPMESHSDAATTVPSDRLMEEIEQRLPGDAKQDDVLSTQKDTIPFPKIVAPPSQSAVPDAAPGLSIKSQANVPEPVNVRKAPTKSRDRDRDRDRDPHGDLNVKSTPSIKPGTTNGDHQLSLLQKSQHRGLGEGPYIDGPESPGKAVADDVSPNALTHGSDAANHPSSSDSDDTTRLDNISIEPANARQQRMAKEQGSSHERTSSQGQMASDGDREVVNTALQQIKSRILSKDFWMRDENCKECFDCGTAFSTWRRKHHCRICGQIFDAKCTSLVSGRRFGQLGSLRVCKRCMEIINEYQDDTDDVESDDDEPLSTSLFHSQSHQARQDLIRGSQAQDIDDEGHGSRRTSHADDLRPLATPMMAIPATRRAGDSHRRSAVLEIDADDINIRPASSRPAKTSSVGRSSTNNHRRHRSRQQLSRSFRTVHEEKAPFHRSPADDGSKGMRLPAFHNDSIIDPDLAPYMSDEGSSGDETAGIFSTMNDDPAIAEPGDNDKGGLGGLLALAKGAKRARSKGLEKSGSVGSFGSRDVDDGSMTSLKAGISRRLSRKRTGTDGFPSPGSISHGLSPPKASGSRMTRSASMKGAIAPAVELNNASLQHVRNLLRQLLQDSEVPHAGSWERALLPILLQCTDDVNPDVRHGDDIDIRHYVKVKRIPGGRPADTSYVSGVVFSKNLALKSMSRTISQPKIVIITFAIEFQRHQTHFMSLEPIIAQEREYLRHMVKRIVALRPQLLLVERNISGLALQYLAEAKVATVYNVKAAVLEAVSRCAQTDIISSIDMLVLKPVHVGRSAGFDLKTYVHKELPGGKKNYIYISGCPPDLGCTIVLRGADTEALAKIKRITEFMVYVVYNLKLETCLMRDEFVLIPSLAERDRLEPAKEVKKRGITDGQTRNSGTPPVGDVANMQSQAGSKGEAGQTSQPDHAVADVSNADVLRMTAPEKGTTSPTDPSRPGSLDADNLPEDVPMPTFYGDMVEKHQTKILSASPFVKFMQPYLLMRAREQERRLAYLKRLKDQDSIEAQTVDEKAPPQEFYLITPEMVHETVKGAPRKVLEALHAVHDAEYDKALHNYETQKRQWEAYISGNINLFDPYAHQNIVVLYTVVCTATAIPCAGPDLLSLAFYDEHEGENDFDPDCTLGQYVEDLCLGLDTMCSSNGCDKRMSEHHRSYVHGEARITVFVEKTPVKLRGLQDTILMWSYCKICHKETQVMPMSENTWKYSFGKYLELSFWSSNLRLRASFCPHDLHRDHLRYFGYKNVALRVHYDPIELLEIIVPRARITWKVELDLQLKNELFTRTEDRVNRFMNSVKARISGISVDSVIPEMADTCKAEIEKFTERAKGDHESLIHDLQDNYMGSKYYEVLPLNCTVRALQEKVAEWDTIFADFDANFFPSEKDIRRLAALQLKKIFIDRDNSLSSIATLDEGTTTPLSEVDETEPSSTSGSIELTPKPTEMSAEKAHDVLAAVVEQNSATPQGTATSPEGQLPQETSPTSREREKSDASIKEGNEQAESIQPLDLALPSARAQAPANVCQEEESRPVSPFETDDRSRGPSAQTSSPDSPDVLPVAPSDQSPAIPTTHSSFTSGIPRPGQLFRRSKTASTTPSMSRTQSQPGPRRGEKRGAKAQQTLPLIANDAADGPSDVVTKPEDRSISERLGLNARKAAKKITGHSLIPRSVPDKRKETRVSALAKHFEQLSRDFERERLRERRLQAAKSRQSRATPMASSKPIVEVYRNVHEAVEEREQSDDDTTVESQARTSTEVPEASESINADGAGRTANSQSSSGVLQSVRSATDGTKSSGDQTGPSQSTSDNEGDATEVDPSLLEDVAAPDTSEGSHSLSSVDPSIDLRLDLPKHERSSLMNMLTNFWAERSASGWAPLEYPLNASDHVFLDSDVIVREDEPSTLIAFALSSEDYRAKLQSIQQADGGTSEAKDASSHPLGHQHDFDTNEQLKVERSLLRSTGTHLKYQFQEGSAKMLCKVFYAEQFDAVRRKCGVADRIVDSLSRCVKWDSKGGKSRSVFLKTLDQRLVLKSLSPIETQAFLKFAPAYFQIMSEALFHELPTVIAKMLGFYQIIIKNPVTGIEIKWDVLVMENLFYDRAPTRIFDLKGSMRGRKIQSTGEQNEVLLDENMVEFIYESPLFVREHSKKLLRASVWNDTLFLARQNVMDYSLMIAIDDVRKELVVGIIDCIRTYTWDKKLESWIKDRGFAGGGRNRPTVTSPKEYKSRFREAMARYVLQAPNCWHQFVAQSIEKRPLRVNDGVTGKDGEKPEGERRRWFVNV